MWRYDGSREPDVYELKQHARYVYSCYVKALNALHYRDSDSGAFKSIIECHYVDDDSSDSEGVAIVI